MFGVHWKQRTTMTGKIIDLHKTNSHKIILQKNQLKIDKNV